MLLTETENFKAFNCAGYGELIARIGTNDDGEPAVVFHCYFEGLSMDMIISHKSQESRNKAFDDVTQLIARSVLAQAIGMVGGDDDE